MDKAMKNGFVTVEFSKFLISGAPGTGKSSFLNLLYNNEPNCDDDNLHDSTNVLAPRPTHVITAINHNLLWIKVEPDKVKEIIAGNIKNNIEIFPEECQEVGSDFVYRSIEQPVATESFQSVVMSKFEETISTEDIKKSDIIQQIIKWLDNVQESKELYKAHWIYGIDTGGQAAFLDIAPALLRYNSVNMFTHKLDERLDDKAKFFFCVQGNVFSEPCERQITNLQFLETSFRSLKSVNPPISSKKENEKENITEPQCIVLGTYYDKLLQPGYSGESLEVKNSILWSKLEELNLKDQAILHREKGNIVIFPVNAIARDDHARQIADEIRSQICAFPLRALIPIRWFLFQLELDQKFCQSNIFVVSKSKCQEIGESLKMNADDVEAALIHYHNLTVFLFFPDILPNVVFLHPQPLFTILSNLISISFPETVDHFKLHGIKDNRIIIKQSAYRELKDEGSFTRDLLSSPLFNGFCHDFTADDFLHLMTNLLIIAYLPKEERFFIPTVLPTTPSFNYDSILPAFKQHVDPLILSWDMKPFPRGIFPALVVNLLHPENELGFQLKRTLRNTQRYRNMITLHTNYGCVLLVDGICWIAIYYLDPYKRCSTIRNVVHTGIHEVIHNFQYMSNIGNLEEYFYCTICSNKTTEHFCHLKEDKKTLMCYESFTANIIDNTRQQPWFSMNGEF